MSRSRIKRAKKRTHRKRKAHIIVALAVLTIIPIILVSLGGLVAAAAVFTNLPKINNLGEVQDWQTTKVYAADGTLLTNLYYEQDRVSIPLSEIPIHMQQAVIAIEDERFYKHKGYDPEAIGRAFFTNLSSGQLLEGASTITQQYIKNTAISREKTFDRKIKEAYLAYQLEEKYTKEQILEKYLNTIYFGHSWYGVETASLNYFGKKAKDLTLVETSLLAGIIKSPNRFSPYSKPVEAKARRDLVLAQMARLKFIPSEQYEQATKTPMQVKPISKPSTVAPYFVEDVKQRLIKEYGANIVFKGGLRVYTTIDLKMQKHAENAAWSILNRPTDPSVALVAIEPKTGYVRAMVGGKNFEESKVNLALRRRQPGSAFKTFVFASAIENGISPYQTYSSSPALIDIPGSTPWKVNNYVEGSGGPPMNIQEGLVKSVNTVYARLIMDVGAENVVETARKMGISSQLNPNPAIALGGLTHGATPLDMASAYGTLADGGKHTKPISIIKITDATGNVIAETKPKPEQVINEATAFLVTDVLEDVLRRGTGTRARISRPAAGKTGTGQEYRDAWFCGYTPDLSVAVWVGYPKGQISMKNVHGIRVSGGSFPAQIWGKFMSSALKDRPYSNFTKPKGGIDYTSVCSETGLLANRYCPDIEKRPFLSEKTPKKKCDKHAKPSITEIPNVVGLSEKEAVERLEKIHFGYAVMYAVDNHAPRGMVASQTPAGGERARQGATIQIVVSAGSTEQKINVPDLVGLDEEQARDKLQKVGLKAIDITATPFIEAKDKRDKVIYHNPAVGTELEYGQSVTIYINRKR
ncbi:MAG: PBP1A family penicillin-binding protein [Actinobacteria bacterium]|nr:PBP1A family penicillin-binding protein [Actinomycetota bacterium]